LKIRLQAVLDYIAQEEKECLLQALQTPGSKSASRTACGKSGGLSEIEKAFLECQRIRAARWFAMRRNGGGLGGGSKGS
jgi:hypothetical protein